MIELLLTITACLFAVIAYVAYYVSVKQSGIIPNRLAWLICSVSITLETITYLFVTDNLVKSLYFIVCAVCSMFITVKIWRLAKWDGASKAQKNSLVFYALALAVWPMFQLPFIAHLLFLIVIPAAFFPIYLSAYKNYKTENATPWLLWSLSDVLVIISILRNMESLQELPYALVNFVCPFTVWCIIIVQRLRQSKRMYTALAT